LGGGGLTRGKWLGDGLKESLILFNLIVSATAVDHICENPWKLWDCVDPLYQLKRQIIPYREISNTSVRIALNYMHLQCFYCDPRSPADWWQGGQGLTQPGTVRKVRCTGTVS
jgi:hypothetical protein